MGLMRGLLLTTTLLVFSVTAVGARTRTVARDGSGDFRTIQAAVDASASGDTVLVGPGRFDEGQVVETAGWTEYVRVLVGVESLTIIGSGESTILGPEEPWELEDGMHKGIVGGPYFGNSELVVERLCIENVGQGIRGAASPQLAVKECTFRGNYRSIMCIGNTVSIDSCVFIDAQRDGEHIGILEGETLGVFDSYFELSAGNPWPQSAINAQLTTEVVIERSTFEGGDRGVYLDTNHSAVIRNSVFCNQEMSACLLADGGSYEMDGVTLSGQVIGVRLYGDDNQFIARNLNFLDVSDVSFRIDRIGGTEDVSVQNCVLAKGAQFVVKQGWPCETRLDDLPILDFTNNDWGTTEADSIAAWIHVCDFEIDYVPFIGQPVAVESHSWSSVKGLFDGDGEE